MMVLAGPGSGKTFVITQRLKTMVQDMDIEPSEILVITFTKAAAMEMENRFHSLMGDSILPVTFGTFHSIYFSILKDSLHYTSSDILTEKEKFSLLQNVLNEYSSSEKNELLGYDTPEDGSALSELLSDISKVKNDGLQPDTYLPSYMDSESFATIFRAYETQCRIRRKVDFDDMVLLCYRLFKERPEILKVWQARFRYILVDEFQDINPMQYEVVKMLALPENNLFIVGDDDQSIYGFRGSCPGIMLNFPKDYKDAKMVCLPKNYRSKAPIVESAVSLIQHNKSRYQKTLTANQEGTRCVYEKGFDTKEKQSEEIVKLITSYQSLGLLQDIAILFRTNTGAKHLCQKLIEAGIPFYYREKAENIWQRPESKDLLSILAYANGDYRRFHLLRFINKPVRYIKRVWLSSPVIYLSTLINNPDIPFYCKNHLRTLLTDLCRIKEMEPYAAISYIRNAMRLDAFLCKEATERGQNPEDILETLQLLLESAKGFSSYSEWSAKIQEYEEKTKESCEKPTCDHITLQTMHGSKGLEYKIVILPDCNEGNIPQGKSNSKESIEEERRVFYVAMTRAKEMLFLFYILKTKENRKEKSRFLTETNGAIRF